jgi:hypothetical protein
MTDDEQEDQPDKSRDHGLVGLSEARLPFMGGVVLDYDDAGRENRAERSRYASDHEHCDAKKKQEDAQAAQQYSDQYIRHVRLPCEVDRIAAPAREAAITPFLACFLSPRGRGRAGSVEKQTSKRL